ncbi:MAG: acetoacetate--CoA ligase [candidate division Zixibacteria bacterium]|nr:acetoacetate--CoA ligase [candidate division Zixibacteria bacterium]
MKYPLWTPSSDQIANSNLTRFTRVTGRKLGRSFDSYHDLYNWSVTDIEDFWASVWEYSELRFSAPYRDVLSERIMPGARWFSGARLNFAENLLRYRDGHTAIIHQRENMRPRRISYDTLYAQVANCAQGLRQLGVTKGDRVAAFIPNIPEAIIAMLATTSIGALWSSCSPDFGLQGVLDRFGQIKPKVLITADGYRYGGKEFDSLKEVGGIVSQLDEIETIVVVPVVSGKLGDFGCQTLPWEDLLSEHTEHIQFEQLPFDHPVYIMYSSGTTGVPKCIVHGAGGTLLQHYKELALHTDLRRRDVFSYYTTCGWMMWNWLVGALQLGTTIYLYDGSPAWPDTDVLWQTAANEGITVFGTSPKYLTACQKSGIEPKNDHDLSQLKAVLSTGAPLTAQNFRWVKDGVGEQVRVSSISGGTDIISCFMLGNPNLPVYSEEIQCRGLGMKVETYNDNGRPVIGEIGELVCTAPFPSMPVSFWNDPRNKKYRAAYFEHFPGVWRHGDYIQITEHGGVIVYGRSDATLNPGGVRIGTAEIYNPVEALEEIRDSLVISQDWQNDVRIVLFVVLAEWLTLDDTLRDKIRQAIRTFATPRHVPAIIIQVNDIPHTINGKKVELAVRRIIHGKDVPNRDALANPEALDQFVDLPELK